MMRLSAEEIALANLFTLGPEEPETLLASVLTAAEKEVERGKPSFSTRRSGTRTRKFILKLGDLGLNFLKAGPVAHN